MILLDDFKDVKDLEGRGVLWNFAANERHLLASEVRQVEIECGILE